MSLNMDTIMSTVGFNVTARNDTIIHAVGEGFDAYGSRPWGYLALALAAYWAYAVFHIKPSKYPTINYDGKAWTYWKAKMAFLKNSQKLLAEGSQKVVQVLQFEVGCILTAASLRGRST